MVQDWFVVRDGKEIGPFALATLKDRIAKGFLTPDTLIRHINAKAPVKAGTVKELFAELGTKPAPPPPPLPPSARRVIPLPNPVPPQPAKGSDRTPAGPTPHPTAPMSLGDTGPNGLPLADIAKWHRWLVRSAALYLLIVVADLLRVHALVWIGLALILISWPPLCYALARALGRPPLPYALLAAVPLVNLGVLLDLGGRATRLLREAGGEVGLFGARSAPDVPSRPGHEPRSDQSASKPLISEESEPAELVSGYAKTAGKAFLLCCVVVAPGLVRSGTDSTSSSAANPTQSAKDSTQGVGQSGTRLVAKPEYREGDVVWSDSGLADEARRLAAVLRETGYTKVEGAKRVELSRSGETRVLRVYVTAAEVNAPRVQRMLRDYAGLLWCAKSFEGKSLELKMCDEDRTERHSYTIEPSSRYQCSPQCYVYHPSSLRTDAERFGRFLVRTGTADSPANWTLTRRGNEWSVCPGLTREHVTEAERVSFRQAARQISDEAFGGQRVELWLFTNEGVESFPAGR